MTAAVPSGLAQQSWTFERAAALDPDVSPGEIVEGEFVPRSRGTYRHGGIAARVWIVDPDKELLLVLSPPVQTQILGVQILGPTDILDGGDVLPGFRCEVAKLFRP